MVQVNGNGVLPIDGFYEKSTSIIADKLNTTYFKANFEGNGSNHMNINVVGLMKLIFK